MGTRRRASVWPERFEEGEESMQYLLLGPMWAMTRVLCPAQPLGIVHVHAGEPSVRGPEQLREIFTRATCWSLCAAGETAESAQPTQRPSLLLGDGSSQQQRTTRLEAWIAQEHGTGGRRHVDAILMEPGVDVLDVLRGAASTLRKGVPILACVLPVGVQSRGMASFSQVDQFLQWCGYELFRLDDLEADPVTLRTRSITATWVHAPMMERLQRNPEAAYEEVWKERAEAACRQLIASGRRQVMLFGSGNHTRVIAPVIRSHALEVVGLLDDHLPRGTRMYGWEVLGSPAECIGHGVQTVVLSSNVHENTLWERTRGLRGAGVEVVRLYPELRGLEIVDDDRALVRATANDAGARGVEPKQISTPTRAVAAHSAPDFDFTHYHMLNRVRLEHLASLDMPACQGARVLEVGAGVGDLTSFFLDRGCEVTTTDVREENLAILRARFAGNPKVSVAQLDLEHPSNQWNGVQADFDVVFCYGVLYHLGKPASALTRLASWCKGVLLLETLVSFGDGSAINLTPEDARVHSQSMHGLGCRPTREWVLRQLRGHFACAYLPTTQPAFEEFPTDWEGGEVWPSERPARAIFVGSRMPLESRLLTTVIPRKQLARSAG
jgi:2-polyprenyl-3-methyl-5-hydroxy-6-metoxy-1,4-benzoquinol methylase